LQPGATWDFHFGLQAQQMFIFIRFDSPEIQYVARTQVGRVSPASPHPHPPHQQVDKAAQSPNRGREIPAVGTANLPDGLIRSRCVDVDEGLLDIDKSRAQAGAAPTLRLTARGLRIAPSGLCYFPILVAERAFYGLPCTQGFYRKALQCAGIVDDSFIAQTIDKLSTYSRIDRRH
jgi:hypothetical protein